MTPDCVSDEIITFAYDSYHKSWLSCVYLICARDLLINSYWSKVVVEMTYTSQLGDLIS